MVKWFNQSVPAVKGFFLKTRVLDPFRGPLNDLIPLAPGLASALCTVLVEEDQARGGVVDLHESSQELSVDSGAHEPGPDAVK